MNPDILFIAGMVVLVVLGFVAYKIISRARVKKLRAEITARWQRVEEQARRDRNMYLDREAAIVAKTRQAETRKVAEAYHTPSHMMANNSIATSSVSAPATTSAATSSSSDMLTTILVANMLLNHSSPSVARSSSSGDDTTTKRSVDTGPSYSDSSSSSSSYSDSSPSYSDSGSSSSSFD
jgi:hypothetical protein